MNLDHVFKKTNKRFSQDEEKKPPVPEGLLCKCSKCGGTLLVEDVRRSYYVCPKCKGYFREIGRASCRERGYHDV